MRALVLLLIFAGAGYWYHYRSTRYTELENLRGEIKLVERNLTEKSALRDRLLTKIEPLRKAREQMSQPGGSEESLTAEMDTLKESLRQSTEKLDAAQTEFEAALTATREKGKQQTFATLKLPSGEELKDAAISKFGEGFLSVTHSSGIVKLEAADLPEGWAERYALDYITKESQAEKEALAQKIDEATIPPLDLKKAELGEIDAQLAKVTEQLLAMSMQMREARRKSDELVRSAYRVALDKGEKGNSAVAKRTAMFRESKKVDAGREAIQKKYKALRDQKLELERQRLEVKKRKVPSPA